MHPLGFRGILRHPHPLSLSWRYHLAPKFKRYGFGGEIAVMGIGDFLKAFFGGRTSASAREPRKISGSDSTGFPQVRSVDVGVAAPHGGSAVRATERYFELSAEIERAKADGDFRSAIAAARQTYPLLPAFVRRQKREYGRFDIARSHAVHTAPILMAVLEDREGIRELRDALAGMPELREWLPAADQAEEDLKLAVAIMAAVQREPGLLQSELKQRIGVADGRRVSYVAGWLGKAGRIRGVRKGATQKLYLPGALVEGGSSSPLHPDRTSGPTKPNAVADQVDSGSIGQALPLILRSRPRRSASRACEIDLGRLPYVRLPKAPLRWAAGAQGREDAVGAETGAPAARFTAEGRGWRVQSEDKLTPAERPDPAYKEVFPTSGSMFWLDRKGHRDGFEDAASVLRVTDRGGQLVAERGLPQDVYRSDVNADGSAILFMSREGLLHGYSDRIEQILAERVTDLPEYCAQATRLGIDSRELRTHIRCVAISTDRSRYLVTAVDEAWCLSTQNGDVIWGLRLPTQEGWTRVATPRTDRVGTSAEVEAALRFMDLKLPVTPEDLTHQYRQLALQWHPDRNPNVPEATRRFQELVAAMELLTGSDLNGMDAGEAGRVTYQKILSRQRFTGAVNGVPGRSLGFEVTISMGVSEKSAADWIYAANFAAGDNRLFLAGYSGKVVEVSEAGTPARVYDVGAVPRQIVHTDSHLYLLTDTRLYILSEDRLDALVDVFDKGTLLVGDTGFGLLESKAFSWFTPTGQRVGAVCTKDPIRRVLSPAEGRLVVETRQHRATVVGAPSWWRS